MERQIDIIIGERTLRGNNSSSSKAYARATIEKHLRTWDNSEITFKEEETKYLDSNHDNILIVSVRMI